MTALTNGESLYRETFGSHPTIASQAPGRVEILGNHTDYNGGYVLTIAIENVIAFYGEPTGDDSVTLLSHGLNDRTTFSLTELKHDPEHPWADYVKGVLHELQQAGMQPSGFQAVIADNLPIGGGISSSAALEMATAFFVKAMHPFEMEPMEIAKLCQRAENNFVGMPCGILDQFSSIFGRKNAFLFLDCDTLDHKEIEVSPPPSIVLCDSMVKHQLVEGEYKKRRAQCEAAAMTMAERLGRKIRFLRDISLKEFRGLEDILNVEEHRRALHVMLENQRVLVGVKALENNDLQRLGDLMVQSHASSRDNFENSCKELDILVEEALQIPGCMGSRLSGGGFGGCTVSLVEPGQVDRFVQIMKERTKAQFGQESTIRVCQIGDGAKILLSSAS